MKIILLINSLYTGGAEFSTLSFFGWLNKRKDVNIKIICLNRADPEYNYKDFGIQEVTFLRDRSFTAKLKELNYLIKEYNPDIVHSVLFDANLLARISRIFKRNFLHIESLVSETYSPYRLKDPHVNNLKLQAYRILDFITQLFGVDHFHANGKSVAAHYQKKLFISPKRITVVLRGRKPNQFLNDDQVIKYYRKEFKAENKVQFINVARHESAKAQNILLDALHEIDELKAQYILLLVGREGHLTKEIKQKIDKYDLNQVVKVLGHRNDVPKLLASSDVFIFPSRFEGLPGALIEAEAAGLPIICTNLAMMKEVVEENNNALLFDVDNVQQLSKQIKKIILNPDIRAELGQNSLQIFNTRFKLEKIHQEMLLLYMKMLKSGKNNI